MARVVAEKQINSFIRGLITEANPLTYPENASLDEDNFILNRDGSRNVRYGMDYEPGYALTDSGKTASQISNAKVETYRWDYAGGDSNISLGVIRINGTLWFYDLLKDNPSAYLMNGGSSIAISGLQQASCDYAIINHSLVLVSADLENPVLLTYNPTTDIISQEIYSIFIRDFFGVDDGLVINERPSTLSVEHNYNLKNQGWTTTIQTVCGATNYTSPTSSSSTFVILAAQQIYSLITNVTSIESSLTNDAINCTKTNLGVYPSNADIWTYGKISDSASANYEKFDPATLAKNSTDTTKAPSGKFIIDIYKRGVSRQIFSGLTGLPTDREDGKVSTVTSYAGRVFYSGILSSVFNGDNKSPNYSGYVFFSQVVQGKTELGKCYQEADPTSENISDIIDTDGGTIHIPNANKIIKIHATKNSVVVFAENGVWEIYGGDSGFRATDYQLDKITSVGVISKDAIVDAGETIFYWAKGGIYRLAIDQVSGRMSAENISLATIQTLYNDFSEITKRYAKGHYDEKEQIIRWLYNDDVSYDGLSNINYYKKELVLDLSLGAFYKQSIGELTNNSPYVAAYISTPNFITTTLTQSVEVNGVQVTVNVTDDVFVLEELATSRRAAISYLTLIPGATYSFTISKYLNTNFNDWEIKDDTGVGVNAYLITGYELFGDILRKKQIPYILFYFERTEDGFTLVGDDYVLNNQSSCLVQAQWNWANSAASGKWGTQFQAYRLHRLYNPSSTEFDYGERVIVTKNKLRGSGRCLSLKIQNESGKDMKLLGWAMKMSGNSDI